jgi:hypothetical protein
VIVPDGVPVDVGGFSIMGPRFTDVSDAELKPGLPLVRVRAYSLMGPVTVRTG